MTKPAVTLKSVKGSPLTTSELDTNFTNLKDATVSITAGSGGTAVSSDLNGNITLVAGTGISLSGNNTSKEITITNTSTGSNSFTTIAVSGQSDVVADTSSDTLTLVAGSGVSITTDSSTDTITIESSYSTVPISTGSASESTSLAIGQGALDSRTGGNGYNTAVGYNALTALTTGDSNIALGTSAGSSLTTGNYNIQIGYSGGSVTSASGNVLVGYVVKASGNNNTLLGNYSGVSTSNNGPSGANNTFLGYEAGRLSSTVSGSNNIVIGYTATPSAFNVSNEITLGNTNISSLRIPGLKLKASSGTITTDGAYDLILNTNSGTNSGSITIADGANQNITISPDGTGKLSVSKAIYSTVSAGVAFVDSYSNAASYANGATVNFSDFSGMVMINRQDGLSGNVALWLCGGGVANKLGDSQANACGTIAGNGGVNGYTWTNDTGVTITASFTAIRGRTGG